MKTRPLAALALSVSLMMTALPAHASAEAVAATYELLQSHIAKVQLRDRQALPDLINDIAMSYSSFDASKHRIKYFYYKENPNEIFLRVLLNENEDAEREIVRAEVERVAAMAKNADDPTSQLAYLNRYLVDTVTYDEARYRDYLAGKEISDLRPWTAAAALLDHRAVCEGYAGAYLLLADALGIPCLKVNGELDGIPHSWNIVYLPSLGEWRHIDVTNNDPGNKVVAPDYKERLFLLPDERLSALGYRWSREGTAALIDVRFPYLNINDLEELRRRKVIVGRENGDFANTAPLTRQELAAILSRIYQGQASEIPTYAKGDVDPWAASAVAFCQKERLMVGFPDGHFHGREPVSKQQLAAVMLRFAGAPNHRWEEAEDRAVAMGLMSPGRTSAIHGSGASRSDIYDILVRSLRHREA